MKKVQYEKFGDPKVLEMVSTVEPTLFNDEIKVMVKAVGLNPVDLKIFGGDIRLKLVGFIRQLINPKKWISHASQFPRGVARDFSGIVEDIGNNVSEFKVGDLVFGTLRSAPGLGTKKGSLVEKLVASKNDVVKMPEKLSFETSSSLGVAGQTACGALRHLNLEKDDVIVISAASGGVGSLAVQIAVSRGATVIGITGEHNTDYVRSLGAIPVTYGENLEKRIRDSTQNPVTKLLDCFGGNYVKLAFSLGLSGANIGTLVPSPKAIIKGAQFTGSRHARLGDLEEVACLTAKGVIKVNINNVYSFDIDSIRLAYSELSKGHVRGKLVIKFS
ncbi:NADP-dependent oxidoreductase [Leuconostoc gelidum subsp. aenigmaticum]|uniref:NADP-dependent oxidoreductase n=1 Tax=Leuconostoc gelidum TaxID=1244 RepID=UPI001CC5B34B|nr:NADP-dependent oxidoreductase [Leuconostoc gelidum]MBZ6008987.1 NADP-dependent oxidoreductase [Leuconostoc gelidum subsp. aenigmaticum]